MATTTINGKPSVFKSVEPPERAKLTRAGADRGRQWEDVARGMVWEVGEQIDRQRQARPTPRPKPEPTPKNQPKPAPQEKEKVYAYLDISGTRKPVMIHQGDDLQRLANEQQRVIIGVQGNQRETFYMPRKPEKVLVFTESKSHIRTLINAVDQPSDRFDERCEDYADKYEVKVVAVFPDGSHREYPFLSVSDRAYLRKYQPTMSQCRRCGSITCAGVGSTGRPCAGKGGRK